MNGVDMRICLTTVTQCNVYNTRKVKALHKRACARNKYNGSCVRYNIVDYEQRDGTLCPGSGIKSASEYCGGDGETYCSSN